MTLAYPFALSVDARYLVPVAFFFHLSALILHLLSVHASPLTPNCLSFRERVIFQEGVSIGWTEKNQTDLVNGTVTT